MDLKSTFRSEEKVEVTLESFRKSAIEALQLFFTPVTFVIGKLRRRRPRGEVVRSDSLPAR